MTESLNVGWAGDAASLAGKVAVVTGAAQGLGATFALALARAGASVVAGDIASTEATCAAIESDGGKALAAPLDVTDSKSVSAMMDIASKQFGGVDILVNNAAISGQLKLQHLTEITNEEWDRVMMVNVRGTFECIKAAAPFMKQRGYGKIINLSSGTAFKGLPGLAHYVASKGAVISLTRAAARELGADGIRVNAIAPGLTNSNSIMTNPAWTSDIVTGSIANRALKREEFPEDLVGTLLFLASPASDFLTGQTIVVDGGAVMS